MSAKKDRKSYLVPIITTPAEAMAEKWDSTVNFGMETLMGGSMNIKFPDDPPVVYMTQ